MNICRKLIQFLFRKLLTKHKNRSYINRPFVTVENKPDLDLPTRDYYTVSPINVRKNCLTTIISGSVKEKNKQPLNLINLNLKSKVDKEEFEQFKGRLNIFY